MRLLRRRLLLLSAAFALPPRPAFAQAAVALPGPVAPLRDSLVKAAFLHRFASFVEWPAPAFPRPDAPLRIAVLGDDQVYLDLEELARDRGRDGRPVQATRLLPGEPLAGHHVLYLRGTPARIAETVARVPEGVLTVADSDGAHPAGAVLSFFFEDGRVRFGVSQQAAARQQLRLNARLLAVARLVSESQFGPMLG